MARFILLWVKKNENVEPIIERLGKSSAVKVVGLFADPQVFCDKSCGRQSTEAWRKNNPSITSRKWGTEHCPLCKKVIRRYAYRLRNALYPEYLPHKMETLSLTVQDIEDYSLYDGRSVWEIFGKKAVRAGIETQRRTAETIKEYRASVEARKARSSARRRRRSR